MSAQSTILIVEDNPITLKLLRVALRSASYDVIEAIDAHSALTSARQRLPDLVVQDLVLPDMHGVGLLESLRSLPGGRELPIIAMSGFLSRIEEARAINADFTALLLKPVEPDRLIDTIRAYLPARAERSVTTARGGRLLVVDDDPVQLKLTRLHFSKHGFDVRTAGSATEAIRLAEADSPDIILSDVFMPEQDGFDLCEAVRRHHTLHRVPVVLLSARYGTTADRDLAHSVGANALALRTPDFAEALTAIDDARRTGAPRVDTIGADVQLAHARQVILQLERQAAASAGLSQRCSLQATQLSLLSGVADALTGRRDIDRALEEVLAATLDAAGISKGALFLNQSDGVLQLRQQVGFSDAEQVGLASFFGHQDLLERMIERGTTVAIPSTALADDVANAILTGGNIASAQIVPLVSEGGGVGAMFIGANRVDVTTDDSITFARAMGNHVVQSLELTRSVARLTASEKRYRALLESASDAIAVLTPSGVIREMNHRWIQILDRAPDLLLGRNIREFLVPTSHEPFRVDALARSALQVKRPNGTTVLMEFSNTRVEVGGESLVFAIGRDVTEQRALEEQLRQSQKLEGIGQLAGGIAHDFNNLLTVILGFGELLTNSLATDTDEYADAIEIMRAGERAASLTHQLLAFSRKQILQPRVLDVNHIISGLMPMLRRLIPEHIELETSLAAGEAFIRIDPTQVEQILINLSVNAVDAMPRGGRLTIATRLSGARADRGASVTLSVADTGIGMDEATQRHIFEPFFTTKEVGKGTGLGLATVHGIVKQSGGDIRVDTEPGKGTTFTVVLPMVTGNLGPLPRSQARSTEIPRGTETILLVEDDDSVRLLSRMTLERAGYTVLAAANPEEAAQVASSSSKPIDLLLSDVVMPKSDGPPLYATVARLFPRVRILYMSGYASESVIRQGLLTEGTPFLHKPFTTHSLAQKVREVLDTPGS